MLVSQVPLFIYLTYTLLIAITVFIEHLRGYQILPLKIIYGRRSVMSEGTELGTVSESESEC